MSVMVDSQPLPAEQMGMKTVGQVLAHIQRAKRMVVHVLVDGREPDLGQLTKLKASPLTGHTLFIETTEPRRMAREVLDQVEAQLAEADRLTNTAVQLLRENQNIKAMEKLRGCFSTWQHAQESVLKVSQLFRIDLTKVLVDGRPFAEILSDFAKQLKLVKSSLETRDFVSLIDTLVYEVCESSGHWRAAIRSMLSIISPKAD
ncbi:MAG TPA: hypothetical protein VHD56_10180 [Tepidisphaeraceae bacterium]|nr:hypothetical protein [Tepidisphaeraceae bacterium]